ncbi:MAG: cytidylate kinase [Dehalococcoidia bacterium]|nr:cytidylate kinase [Dehalococcoidia bacterium]
MSKPAVIAIDGPGASGKDTVGRLLAGRLGFTFVDTGAMYRAVTWLAMKDGVALGDEAALSKLAMEATIQFLRGREDPTYARVTINGDDVTDHVHNPDVDVRVSLVARVRGVRDALVSMQRQMGESGGVVMAGRDIGTVVLPEAPLKIYLEASLEERARRRYLELRSKGEDLDFDKVLAELRERDRMDTERKESPLRPAVDAKVIVTDGLDPERVVTLIMEEVKAGC